MLSVLVECLAEEIAATVRCSLLHVTCLGRFALVPFSGACMFSSSARRSNVFGNGLLVVRISTYYATTVT